MTATTGVSSAAAGPWRSAARTLRGNRVVLGSCALLTLIVLACAAAPWYAQGVAHTDPFTSNPTGSTLLHGRIVPVLAPETTGLRLGVTPIGPTGDPRHFLLGADQQGRDLAARLLYGGRNSLLIAFGSAALCCAVATPLGLVAGYLGGRVDGVLSRVLDVLWAFPVYLLAICLSVVLIGGGLRIGPVAVSAGSLWLPVVILALVYLPYVARPLRGQVISLRARPFVLAAIGCGASTPRVICREVLPHVLPGVVVMLPLVTSITLLTESALSFLSIGVQPPDASWGTIADDGLGLLYTRPVVGLAPGVAIALTAVALNLIGDGVRDALDPRSRSRLRAASRGA